MIDISAPQCWWGPFHMNKQETQRRLSACPLDFALLNLYFEMEHLCSSAQLKIKK